MSRDARWDNNAVRVCLAAAKSHGHYSEVKEASAEKPIVRPGPPYLRRPSCNDPGARKRLFCRNRFAPINLHYRPDLAVRRRRSPRPGRR